MTDSADMSADSGSTGATPTSLREDGWHRLHPTALIVETITALKALVSSLIGIVAFFGIFRTGTATDMWVLVLGAAAVIGFIAEPISKWLTTRYRLDEDGLALRTGLFRRSRRMVSYDRIHAITVSQPVYMRPFDVVQLAIATGDATDGSIILAAVPKALQTELERLRSAYSMSGETAESARCASGLPGISGVSDHASSGDVVDDTDANGIVDVPQAQDSDRISSAAATHRGPRSVEPNPSQNPAPMALDAAPTATPARLVFRASTRDILLFALTDLGFLAAAVVLWGFVQQVEDVLPRHWTRMAADSLNGMVARGALALAGLLLAAVAVLLVFSVIAALVRFYGFEVRRRGDDLVVERGLLTRRTMTMPISRIQTIVVRRNPLRRIFGLCSVELGLSAAGLGEAGDTEAMEGANVLPMIGRAKVYEVLRDMLPEWDLREPDLHRTGRGLLRYYLLAPVAASLALAAGAAVSWALDMEMFWLISFAIGTAVALLWLATRGLKARVEGYAILPDATAAPGTSTPTDQNDGESTAQTAEPHDGKPLSNVASHRIAVGMGQRFTEVMLFTRRARVQNVQRNMPAWRVRHGIERLTMPLFVMNGLSWLRFTFIRRADANVLAAWFEA